MSPGASKVVERSAIVHAIPRRRCTLSVNDVRALSGVPALVQSARVVEDVGRRRALASRRSRARACCAREFTTRNTLQPDAQIVMRPGRGAVSQPDGGVALRAPSAERGSQRAASGSSSNSGIG